MFMHILQNIPRWVWMLLAVLIAIGISQSFTRRRTLRSAIVIPIVMIVLSLFGVISVFTQPLALAAWAAAVATALAISNTIEIWRNISWSEPDQKLIMPGSWIPMMLILGLFATKFSVGIALAMDHGLVANTTFAIAVSFAYGSFSGIFLGRGVAMWNAARHAMQPGMAN
jgi:hypothetical protein